MADPLEIQFPISVSTVRLKPSLAVSWRGFYPFNALSAVTFRADESQVTLFASRSKENGTFAVERTYEFKVTTMPESAADSALHH